MPTDIYEINAAYRKRLLARDAKAAGEIVRAYGSAYRQLQAEMDKVLKDLAANPDSVAFRVSRLRILEGQLVDELARFGAMANDTVTTSQGHAVQLAVDGQAEMLTAALTPAPAGIEIAAHLVQLPTEAMEALVGFASDGSHLNALFEEIAPGAAETVRDRLLGALAMGQGPDMVAEAFKDEMGVPLTRALRISRTEMMRAFNEGSRQTLIANAKTVNGWYWMADTGSTRTCFPAGVLVSGPRAVAGTSRYYTGELIVLTISDSEDLSVTPNHPILTPQGWVAAGLLRDGDYVLSCADGERAAPRIGIDDYQRPSSIEDVVNAFGMVAGEVETTAPDFHGDGVGSNIHVVRTDGLLRNAVETALPEPGSEHDFGSGHVNRFSLRGDAFTLLRRLNTRLNRHHAYSLAVAPNSFAFPQRLGPADNFLAFIQRSSGNSLLPQARLDRAAIHAIRVGKRILRLSRKVTGSDFAIRQFHSRVLRVPHLKGPQGVVSSLVTEQSSASQFSDEPLGAYTEARRDALCRLTGNIRLNRVLKVHRRRFSGHVYNLQTNHHWYLANCIIVANCSVCYALHGTFHTLDETLSSHVSCRCSPVPSCKSWADMGYPGEDDLTWKPEETGEEAFAKLSDAEQKAVLGKGKYDLYKAGDLKLADLVEKGTDERWGPYRVEKPLWMVR